MDAVRNLRQGRREEEEEEEEDGLRRFCFKMFLMFL